MPHGLYDPARHDPLLGTMTDQALADMIGVSKAAVTKRRAKLGIPSFASQSGPVEAIRRRRLVLGLGVDRRRRGTYDPALHDVFLGLMPDAVLAAKIGTTARAIGDRRRALAVPAFVGPRTRVRPEAVSRAGPEAAARAAGPGEDSGEANP